MKTEQSKVANLKNLTPEFKQAAQENLQQIAEALFKGSQQMLESGKISVLDHAVMLVPDHSTHSIVPSILPMFDPNLRIPVLQQAVKKLEMIAYVLLYSGEIINPLPYAPTPAVMVIQCTPWDYFRWQALPYRVDEMTKKATVKPIEDLESAEDFRQSFQTVFFPPTNN